MRRGRLLSHMSVWAAIGLSTLPVCPAVAAAHAAGDAEISSPSTVEQARELLKQARYADAEAAAERLAVLDSLDFLAASVGADELAKLLISGQAIPATEPRDAAHISLAAVNGAGGELSALALF